MISIVVFCLQNLICLHPHHHYRFSRRRRHHHHYHHKLLLDIYQMYLPKHLTQRESLICPSTFSLFLDKYLEVLYCLVL